MTKVLSRNDRLVLSRVFESNPDSLVDPELPIASEYIPSPKGLADLQLQEQFAIAPLNDLAPSQEELEQAAKKLTDLILSYPTYSSAYNNRAQVLRLLHGDDLYSKVVKETTIWDDLCTAIKLVSPSRSNEKVSEFQGRILRAAYAQRGYLIWKAAKGANGRVDDTHNLPTDLRNLSQNAMEERAIIDLEMAGKYGDQEAMKMAVSANPYARLCGNIVNEAMRVEMEKLTGSTNWITK